MYRTIPRRFFLSTDRSRSHNMMAIVTEEWVRKIPWKLLSKRILHCHSADVIWISLIIMVYVILVGFLGPSVYTSYLIDKYTPPPPAHRDTRLETIDKPAITNDSGFRPPLCTYKLNWTRRTSWGWWDDWDDTVLQTQDSEFEPWQSEAEHATSRSRRLPTILTVSDYKTWWACCPLVAVVKNT